MNDRPVNDRPARIALLVAIVAFIGGFWFALVMLLRWVFS